MQPCNNPTHPQDLPHGEACFSFFRAPIHNTVPYKAITLHDAYRYIRGAYAHKQTAHLRTLTDAKAVRSCKATWFDYCTFSGTFSRRSDSALLHHSGLLCVDFDHVDDCEVLFEALLTDGYFETQLLKVIEVLHRENNLPLNIAKEVGIIVPFRSQIALIQKEINELEIGDTKGLTIDTVERYQGSQRNIIIFCTTVQQVAQLELFSAPVITEDIYIDRKLNVALTRARKQLFILGNSSLLSHAKAYHTLLEYIHNRKEEGVNWLALNTETL